ncbi:MAG TPA: septation protein SepH [Nakamurella sp.]|nr:septation protein SepH [Nakamurella sp.]
MRALRVLGIAEDGDNLVCEDGTSGELFVLPADERLRAAVRGDLSRLGRLEIERQPQLRPREIQSRIRAGSSIAEVAAAAHTSVGRIERYAYPVLLERSTMAERARLSHPMVDGEPARRTLEELVTCTLSERGQNTGVQWDSYRDDDGWVVILRWQAGRSENHASWEVHAGPRTNTLRPRDGAARDLVDPTPHPLRTIADGVTAGPPSPVLAAADGDGDLVDEPAGPGETPGTLPPSHHPAGSRRTLADRLDQDQLVERTVLDERAGTRPAPQTQAARTGTDNTSSSRANRKGHHPVMPGWEDVLLGGGQPGG